MSGWDIFSSMAQIGGDILSFFSIAGSTFVLIDSLLPNPSFRRLGRFVDMSIVGLVMGAIGQFSISYTQAQVERIGFLQLPITVVNILLALSFLFLLASWFIRRNRRAHLA